MSVIFQKHESNSQQFVLPDGVDNMVKELFQEHDKELLYINYYFCSDDFVLELNKDYLDHDYYTDILTFDLSDNDHEIEADVFVSTDRVLENASNLGVEFSNELVRLIFHGGLHLIGFNDKTEEQKEIMTQQEDVWLAKCFT